MESIVEDMNLLGNVHRRVVVAFVSPKYLALADHLQMAINFSFQRLKRGRLVQKVTYEGQIIFLLTLLPGNEGKVGTVEDEEELIEAFARAGEAGKVTTDPYELKLANNLISKFGTTE